jgi:pimeloyl-ACP methyl ester carboxylesterase
MSAEQPAGQAPVRRRHHRRWIYWTTGVVLVVILAFFAGGGWYFSSKIRSDALYVEPPGAPDYQYTVLGVSDGIITLALPANPSDDLVRSQVLGVEWEGGYGQVSTVVAADADSVTRAFLPLTGSPPVGILVAFDAFAYPDDPAVVGIDWDTVTYDSGLGPADAWYVDGTGSTWAIFVHGRGASPAEALRALPIYVAAGFPALVITYRNDPGAPEVPDRLARFGATEWEDLEGAVRYALDHGAAHLVLVGYSMGGAIVVSFLLHSGLANLVEGAVLEAPALSLGAMVDARAGETSLPLIPVRVPVVLTATAKWIASWRFGVNLGEVDYTGRAGELNTPILLIHGDEDGDVPVALAEAFAAARPDLVRLEVFPGAGHVKAWNVDPERYQTVVADFLAGLEG